jgi:hypothetical protein
VCHCVPSFCTVIILPTRQPLPSILSNSEWCIRFDPLSFAAVVMIGKGRTAKGQTQKAGGLPIPTKAPDQTKNQVVLHVEHPTKPYRILCSRSECHWQIRFGLPMLTISPFWLAHRYRIVLPNITGRGVKYTHNDIKHTVLHSNRGPLGLCGISPASNQKEITPPYPHDPQSILGQEPAVLTPQPHRSGRTA